ncbi:MAG: twin-arginine translocase subunit TatC [Deltaproteobacteria bacterium]|jgi:sec-independent protein translocase protein TatC|nr:twin-arginine translocase subunit TatC [Deltaproteobacteria bacterium]
MTTDNDDNSTSQENEKTLDFFGHLGELRRRLIKCVVCITAMTIACWNLADSILTIIIAPVLKLLPPNYTLVYTGLTDAFSVTFKISLWAGVVLSSPFCLYQLWAFVSPGLYRNEKAKVPFLTFFATLLFLIGTAFAYFIAFPLTFKFFLAFSSEAMQPLLTVDRYMSLVMGLIIGFAIAFQMPLVLMFLGDIGVITPQYLKKQRSYAIIIIFIVAAIATPPDVISQVLMAFSLMFLYELSIFMVKRQVRKNSLKEDDQKRADSPEEGSERSAI